MARARQDRASTSRTIFFVHRNELVDQAFRALVADGLPAESIYVVSGSRVHGRADGAIVTLASAQACIARDVRPEADLAVFDEFHHYVSDEFVKLVRCYRDKRALVIGLTATPARGDDRPIGDIADALICPTSIRELTSRGVLVPTTVLAPAALQKSGQLASDPIRSLLTHRAKWSRAIVFAANVGHAKIIASQARDAGLRADAVWGAQSIEGRRDTLAKFAAGEIDVLTNCMVLTEGFDVPATDCVVLARPIGHVSMWLQTIGRALRASPGKSSCLVLDLAGSVHVAGNGLPDDDRDWSLAGTSASTLRDGERLPTLRQCRSCGAVARAGKPACERCGEEYPPPPLPTVQSETLGEIGAAQVKPVDKRAQFLAAMHRKAQLNGYRPGWAAFQFKNRYGYFPTTAQKTEAGL